MAADRVRFYRISLVMLLGVACSSARPRPRVEPGGGALHEYLDRLARLGAFSGSALVARGDTVLLDGGYGLADRRRGIPVTRATVFDIGSVAKQFAAAAVLRLEIDGHMRTDDPLERYFPDAPPDKRAITIDELLTHTSGLPGDLETGDARVTAPDDPKLAARLLALPLESAPGTTFRYSNAGYALVRLAIERVTHEPYERYVTDHLLRPAGVMRTGWHGDRALWAPDQVARGAWGLYDSGSPRDWPLRGATLGAGEMVSSPEELFRWLRALDAGRVLPEDAQRKLFTPRARWDGAGAEGRGPDAHYAYGWEVRTRADGTVGLIFHNGTYDNFRTTVRRYPKDDAVVIVATNARQQDSGDRADEVGNALRNLMLGKEVAMAPPTIDLPSRALASFAGTYEAVPGAGFHLWVTPPNRLWLAPHGQRAFDAIWRPDRERATLQESVARRTLETIDTLRSTPCVATRSGWSGMFCDLIDSLGPFERAALEGVAPLTWSKDSSMSYTVLHFARGQIAVTWEWRGEELVQTMSSDDVPEPQSVPLAATAPAELIMYDWFTDRTLPVHSGRDAIVVGDGPERLRAERASTLSDDRQLDGVFPRGAGQ
ncbi:MAG TPA: serine hydrolase domain-containing protein [Candidatus Polarisedimenticolaceae bacterium]|nr:serine hydrolase domain-containing protein [Candidatus Polarisedimenticolaceae bacterium]